MIEKDDLLQIARQTMPFGKFQGRLLIDLPEPYLLWFANNGWPNGKLGHLLQVTLEIKINGLDKIVEPLKLPVEAPTTKPKVHLKFDD